MEAQFSNDSQFEQSLYRESLQENYQEENIQTTREHGNTGKNTEVQ